MLRSFLINLSKARWAQRLITGWRFAWRAASRFVAGDTVADAIRVVEGLNARGINVTLDHLGESTTTRAEAVQAADDILELLDRVQKAGVRANVSVKLTQVGLILDPELCAVNLERILARSNEYGNFVRIDMEDYTCTDRTLELFGRMRARLGNERVGAVLQSYLYRTEEDARRLLAEGSRLRLVKGAYKEPAEVAYPRKADVDASFDRLAVLMIDAALAAGAPLLSPDGRIPPIPAFGTHDENRIGFARQYAEEVGLPRGGLEFQMLYGIRRDLQQKCVEEGYPVRVYVPYGTHWYPYFMRRLAERPANVWFFVSNYFRK
jgi:proline dehydrogenase